MDLLDDVPQVSGVLERQHAVVGSHFVKSRALLVAKERVRDPDGVPAVVAQTYLGLLAKVFRIESQSRICPVLS